MPNEPSKAIEVLIVEDDVFLRKILATKFGKEGFEVRVAEDGVEALDMLRQAKPSLVLLDLILPKVSGFEVLTEMRTDEGLKDVPVIVLSNLGQEEDHERATELGAIAFMTKADYSINQVVMKVKEEYAKLKQGSAQ
ncbi:MAG: response regulator [Patescibacteria group bacterium]|nr:response regulator [Patescibacteria group bacterium]